MLHITEVHEFVSEWDECGSTVARLHYIDGQGNCYGQEVPPRDFPWEPEPCPNPWCDRGWMVWVEGETEHGAPCPDCEDGDYLDMRLEDAAIDRWEAQQDHLEFDNRYEY